MTKFNVTGMSCAACTQRVEKAVKSVEGVTFCEVNLLTNSMNVEGSASIESIIQAVEKAGYGAYTDSQPKQNQIPQKNATLKRLIASVCVLLVLVYFSMGVHMWGFPVPKVLANHVSLGLIQLLLATIILVINKKFFTNGIKGVIHKSPNMDTLVALGSGISFAYSVVMLFAMIFALNNGDNQNVEKYAGELYFESSAMILTLITVGKTLEEYSKGKTTNAIKGLMELAPQTAIILKDGQEMEISVDDVKVCDHFVVKSGCAVAVDGVVVSGSGSVDEASLTGESVPSDKNIGDSVYGGTINKSGYMIVEATRVGQDTTLQQIIKTVNDATASKAPIAKIADKVSGVFVPIVLGISLVTLIVWLAVGQHVGYSLSRAITVLVISCPCALGLATPVAIMVGSGKGARNGILFKNAEALENSGKIQVVALDKTGTVTMGVPSVTDICVFNGTQDNLLKIAYSLEYQSEHPLSIAVVKKAEDEHIERLEVENFENVLGCGIKGIISGQLSVCGNKNFIEKYAPLDDEQLAVYERLSFDGKTPLFFVYDGVLLGIIAVADTIKEDSKKAIADLKNMGVRVVMLTGDNQNTANAIGKLVGIDEIYAGVLPNQKESIIKELKKQGRVAMVGDGINDAPSLTTADVGIAIGAGTDIAIDAADVVLVSSKLSSVVSAVRLGKRTLINIYENLFWAFIYNVIGIPLASGLLTWWFGWELKPMFGALAMSLSSFCVVTNALRLNLVNIVNPKHEIKIKQRKNKKEKKSMTKTMKIQGMMCNHCVSTVKKALLAIDGVQDVEITLATGEAKVTTTKAVSDDVLKKAVEEQDFTVVDIK